MAETLARPESDFVQLLDDDVRLEPESVRRSIMFGRYATTPTIVGAHMFDLLDRPKLHAWAEVVDEEPFMWRNLYQEKMPHDFSVANLRQQPLLHMRLDADYNGWWMCLIPVEVIREVGPRPPRFHQMGRCGVLPARRGKRGSRPYRCPESLFGMSPGWARTTRSTGRHTSTPAIGSQRPCCTRTLLAAERSCGTADGST